MQRSLSWGTPLRFTKLMKINPNRDPLNRETYGIPSIAPLASEVESSGLGFRPAPASAN